MKKTVAFVTALCLAMLALGTTAAAAGAVLVKDKGIELRLLDASISTIGDSSSIRLLIRGINNTDHKVWADLKDAKVDGVPVLASTRSIAAHSDTGDDDPLRYTIWGSDVDHGAGNAAIASAKKLVLTVNVQDNDTYERLITKTVAIDLASVGAGSADSTPAPSGSSSASSSRTASAYTPASRDYTTLKQGSKGQAVRDLQQRLNDLGYMDSKVDGKFGKITATAVMSFCTQNGLYVSGDATPQMQQLLYSSSAEYYVEPWVPLIIGPRYKWENPKKASNDIGWFYVQIVNRSQSRTVRGYELYYYMTDVWGEKITTGNNNAWLYPMSYQHTIKPGYLEYAKPFAVSPFAYTYCVWVGVHKIVFDDGEIREIDPDEIRYFECPVKK